MKTKSSLTILLLLALVAPIFGQNPVTQPQQAPPDNDDEVVRITTNLIQVDAMVTDKNGKPVTDLRADEFEIKENNKTQEITNFSYVQLASGGATQAPPPAPVAANSAATPVKPVVLRPEQVRRTIALVVDDLGLSAQSIPYVRRALKKFVDEQMQPDDLVAIIRTAGGIGTLQQFTSDKRQLYASIERVRYNPLGRGGIGIFEPLRNEGIAGEIKEDIPNGGSTSLEDETSQFRDEVYTVGTLGALSYIINGLRDLPGRKSVMLLSDGFKIYNQSEAGGSFTSGTYKATEQSTRVLNSLRGLTDLANRASVVIYTMDVRGLQSLTLTAEDNFGGIPGRRMQEFENAMLQRRLSFFESQDGLRYLAQQTGGLSIRNNNDLSGGIKQMLNDQQGYYLIGYHPDEKTFDPKRARFNKLTIKVKRPGLKVRYRSGFFGITDEQAKPAPPQTRVLQLARAITSPFASGDISLRLTSLFANDMRSGSYMRSLLHVDANGLTFTEEADGWHKATFDVLAITFGDNGKIVDQVNRTENMRVRGETYQNVKENGFDYYITVPIRMAGAYQLRAALRDTATERVGSATQFVEVPDINKNRLTLSGIIITGFDPDKPKNAAAAGTAAIKQSGAQTKVETDPQATPALRRLRRGMVLEFGYVIYNARRTAAMRPRLQTQIRLFRDGKEIFAGETLPFDTGNQTDLQRLSAGGRLQLGTDMPPGEYVLQIIVTDLMVKGKQGTTTQWIDFQVQ